MKSHMGNHDLNVLVIPLSSFKADFQQILTGVVASLLGIELPPAPWVLHHPGHPLRLVLPPSLPDIPTTSNNSGVTPGSVMSFQNDSLAFGLVCIQIGHFHCQAGWWHFSLSALPPLLTYSLPINENLPGPGHVSSPPALLCFSRPGRAPTYSEFLCVLWSVSTHQTLNCIWPCFFYTTFPVGKVFPQLPWIPQAGADRIQTVYPLQHLLQC